MPTFEGVIIPHLWYKTQPSLRMGTAAKGLPGARPNGRRRAARASGRRTAQRSHGGGRVFHVKHSRPADGWRNPRVSRIATGSWRSRHSARRQPTRSTPRGIQPARPASRGVRRTVGGTRAACFSRPARWRSRNHPRLVTGSVAGPARRPVGSRRPAAPGGRLAGLARSAPRGVQPARPASRGRRLMRPPTPRLVVSGRRVAGASPCAAEPARPASRDRRGGGAGTAASGQQTASSPGRTADGAGTTCVSRCPADGWRNPSDLRLATGTVTGPAPSASRGV